MYDIFIFGHERAALQPLQSNVFKLQTKCCILMCTNLFQIFILIGGASLTQHDFEIPFHSRRGEAPGMMLAFEAILYQWPQNQGSGYGDGKWVAP